MNRAGVMKWASHMLVLVCILHVPPLLPRCSRARVRAALRAARRPRICCGTMDWAGTMDRAGVMEWASHMLVLTCALRALLLFPRCSRARARTALRVAWRLAGALRTRRVASSRDPPPREQYAEFVRL